MFTRLNPRPSLALSAALGLMVGHAAVGDDYHVRPQSGEALIVNSGSTNTTGYTIYVQSTGHVRYVVTGRASTSVDRHLLSGHVAKAQAGKLFHDLAAAMPFAKLPSGHGVKSVSFGTSLFITYRGTRTPDLSFPVSPEVQALKADATAIAAALKLSNTPRRPVGLLTPRLP